MKHKDYHKGLTMTKCTYICAILLSIINGIRTNENTHMMPPLECYDPYGRPQRCIPGFENAAFGRQIEATNTCGQDGEKEFCVQTGYSNRKSCEICRPELTSPAFLTDLHDPNNPTTWQSETMFEGIQYPNQVNLTLNLGKSFDITYIRIWFHSPRPESFAIYKRVSQNGNWIPYQYYSATCRDTYGLPDLQSVQAGEDEARALCTSEYSDISPLRDGNVAYSSLEGRPSAHSFDHSIELQNWVTATDIRITLDRLNTFGDEVFGDAQVLKSYFYAIADIAIGARCKCNGHASKCVTSSGLNGQSTRVCECKHFTDGPDCEKCLPFYNDAPWGRATNKNVHECKPCNCNGFSTKCYFDKHLYNQTGHGGHCLDCNANRDGPNCERCKENFFMRDDGYCINCECDPIGSRSLQCNSVGKCQCKPGVTGDKCDRCEDNHYNFGPHGCQHCGCDQRGSLENKPSCDPQTGACLCKENVEGKRCKECKPGFFNLDLENKFGCTPCFCYGHTSDCQSAAGYSIVSISSTFNKHKEKWIAINDRNQPVDIKYNQFSQTILTPIQGHENIYFKAPERFLGDQRASYNRLLKFSLQLNDQVGPNPSSTDVILEGADTRISLPIFAQSNSYPDQQLREYSFRLHENSEYGWQPSVSSRIFMSILSNLTAIKIRASYSQVGEAILDDVELQTAHRGAAGRPATWIEQCMCPDGYVGQFCESCAPGFRHSPALGGPFMPCIPCDCNKHAEICDSETGRCICKDNTAGDTCDQCARGFYGNALDGTPYDCKACPCPDNGSCMQLADESVICLECPVGYIGSRCELCSDGYFGDPTGANGQVQLCQQCDCNGNVDPNAVGNCNRSSGECLKCIYNTGGSRCEECLPGHFGDPLALPHGNCERCSCYPQGTEQTNDGVNTCDSVTGNCHCKPNVIGKNCNECAPGYFNIISGNGCESCNCDPIGSFNNTCDRFSGQCYCKPGVVGLRCDQCAPYQYGFSSEGCKSCNCDASGSKGLQCDDNGQCPCNDNVEGKQCDRCKENKYDREQGCLNCPFCYNLVQDAANEHRAKLNNLRKVLQDIASNPTVIDDDEFKHKLEIVQEEIDYLLKDAKSGSGGGDRTLVERLNDLHHKIITANDLLDDFHKLRENSLIELDKASGNVSLTQRTIQNAQNELNDASDELKIHAQSALNRAKDKSDRFGQQSEQISEISRQARNFADQLEQQAENQKAIAKEANEKASAAYDLAKNAINLQKNISEELRSGIRSEILQAEQKLKTVSEMTAKALEHANKVYDDTLTLFANVNSVSAPDIDIEKLKNDATEAYQNALDIEAEANKITSSNSDLRFTFDEEKDLAIVLLDRAKIQSEDALLILKDAEQSYKDAKSAVEKGDATLNEAQNTLDTLTGFQSQVEDSSKNASMALRSVNDIEKQILKADNMTREAESAIEGSKWNAEQAKLNAKEAQDKYAGQASIEAEKIKTTAGQTKLAVDKLRAESDGLNERVESTEVKLAKLEDLAQEDNALTKAAKETVGQSQTETAEAQNITQKAMDDIQAIMNELKNLHDINIEDLDDLERRLKDAENELEQANLSQRIDNLIEIRNTQNQSIKNYRDTIIELESEVNNIRLISEALPNECFKRPRLEP